MAGETLMDVSEASSVFWTITLRFRVVRPGSLDGWGRMWSLRAQYILDPTRGEKGEDHWREE
jgi:hypothetical protein